MIYKIRDSVDVYTLSNDILMFYFINTRQRFEYKVSKQSIELIKIIDGKLTVDELTQKYNQLHNTNIKPDSVQKIFDFLESKNILVQANMSGTSDSNYRFERQINYLAEFSKGSNSGIENQTKIENTKVLIFGCGAVGGDIALELAMAGVKNISLLDHDIVEKSDIARHMYFKEKYVGMPKVNALKREMLAINKSINVNAIFDVLSPKTDIDMLICDSDFIFNTADEPYIGFTSLKISRICCKYNKPHYIAGGFDIHVMSTGELIIPGKTPCVNCYLKFFNKTLSNWKPENKKVIDYQNEYGGFASQSLFAASYAVMQFIKYLCGFAFDAEKLTRGEVDFDSYAIQYLDVKRDSSCPVCGAL